MNCEVNNIEYYNHICAVFKRKRSLRLYKHFSYIIQKRPRLCSDTRLMGFCGGSYQGIIVLVSAHTLLRGWPLIWTIDLKNAKRRTKRAEFNESSDYNRVKEKRKRSYRDDRIGHLEMAKLSALQGNNERNNTRIRQVKVPCSGLGTAIIANQ